MAVHVARIVANVIRNRNALGLKAVLGLPAGSTPVGVYRELVRLHREEDLEVPGQHGQPRGSRGHLLPRDRRPRDEPGDGLR